MRRIHLISHGGSVLTFGKQLVMPTPRLKSGFLLITPVKGKERSASSIKGAFKHGSTVAVDNLPLIDLVVQGAVAVDHTGGRLGKGGGYGDREISLLKTHDKMPEALIAVTVHDIQMTKHLPQDSWDLTVDIIVTPTRIIRTSLTKREAVSKYMSYFLRHNPPTSMSEDGFLCMDELLQLIQCKYTVDEEFIITLVKKDSKGRFQIQNGKIRAVYGHSVPVSIDLPLADVDILYHGTTEKAARRILKEGLIPMGRQKLHLSPTAEVAIEVGKRKCDHPVILQIDARNAVKSNISIEKASELVYVADFIPPAFISVKANAI